MVFAWLLFTTLTELFLDFLFDLFLLASTTSSSILSRWFVVPPITCFSLVGPSFIWAVFTRFGVYMGILYSLRSEPTNNTLPSPSHTLILRRNTPPPILSILSISFCMSYLGISRHFINVNHANSLLVCSGVLICACIVLLGFISNSSTNLIYNSRFSALPSLYSIWGTIYHLGLS